MMHPRLSESLITAMAESSWNETHSKWDQWATAPLSEKRYHAEDTEENLSWFLYKIDKDNLRREKRDARAAKWEDWKARTFHRHFLTFLNFFTRR